MNLKKETFNYILVQTQDEHNRYRIIQRAYLYPKKWFLVYNCNTDDMFNIEYGRFIKKDILEISESILRGKTNSNKFITAKRIGNVLLIEDEF